MINKYRLDGYMITVADATLISGRGAALRNASTVQNVEFVQSGKFRSATQSLKNDPMRMTLPIAQATSEFFTNGIGEKWGNAVFSGFHGGFSQAAQRGGDIRGQNIRMVIHADE
jgi:hypothetical protein